MSGEGSGRGLRGDLRAEHVQVDPFVVLYAFRYGLGRFTYAHGDALKLMRDHWPHLRQWRDSIEADLERIADEPAQNTTLACGNAESCDEALEWIAEVEGENPGPQCLYIGCDQTREGRRSRWWVKYGCCTYEHTEAYYGEESIDREDRA